MKNIQLIALLVFLMFTDVSANETKSFNNEVNQIRDSIYQGKFLSERTNLQGVNPKYGIVRKEVVMIKNGFRYTIWDLDWFQSKIKNQNINQEDVLRVYYRKNGTKGNYSLGIFEITKTGKLLYLNKPYTKGFGCENKKSSITRTCNNKDTTFVKKHLKNILQ